MLAAGVAAVVVAVGLLAAASFREVPPAGAPARAGDVADDAIVTADRETVTAGPAVELRRAALGRGGTLSAALADLGLDRDAAARALAAARAATDLRRLPAGAGLTATVRDGTVERVALRHAADRWLEIPLDGSPAVERAVPVVLSVATAAGTIESSVTQAFGHAAEPRALVHAYADIFQWDVDLLIDPRPGDRVRAVYELRRYGALPDDLPDFAGARTRAGQPAGIGRVLAATYEGSRVASRAYWVVTGDPFAAGDVEGSYFDEEGRPLKKAFLKSPLNYRRISSGFSRARRHPVTGRVRAHTGVDFAAPRGTPVVATADGTVVGAGWMGGLGRAVRVRHVSGYVTVYGHFSRIAPGIRKGVRVKQNQVVGYVGATGTATGNHLHYTMYANGVAIDPLRFKSDPAEPLPASAMPRLRAALDRWEPVLAALPVEPGGYTLARGGLGWPDQLSSSSSLHAE